MERRMLADEYEWPPGKGLVRILITKGYHSVDDIAAGFGKSRSQTEKAFKKEGIHFSQLMREETAKHFPELKKLIQKHLPNIKKKNELKRQRKRALEFEKMDQLAHC